MSIFCRQAPLRAHRPPSPYVFNITAELKLAARRRGEDIIDMSMGNPDGATPPAHRRQAHRGRPAPRHPRLLDLEGHPAAAPRHFATGTSSATRSTSTRTAKPSSPSVPRKALAHLMLATLDHGDTVLVPDPSYPIHIYGAVIAGADIRSVPLVPGVDFFGELERAIRGSDPEAQDDDPGLSVSNPTAQCVELDFFERVVALAPRSTTSWWCTTWPTPTSCFDGWKAPSIMQVPGAKDMAVEFFTLSKSYNMAGWRIGFMVGNPELVTALARIKSYHDYGTFTPMQVAAIAALEGDQACVRRNRRQVPGAARRAGQGPARSRLGWSSPQGLDVHLGPRSPSAYREPWVRWSSPRNCWQKAKVCVSPGIGFGDHGDDHVRFALIENEAPHPPGRARHQGDVQGRRGDAGGLRRRTGATARFLRNRVRAGTIVPHRLIPRRRRCSSSGPVTSGSCWRWHAAAAYVWLLRRRNKAALRYSSLGVVRDGGWPAASGGGTCRRRCCCWPARACCWRRHGRWRGCRCPGRASSIMLAIDVSLSMRVSDVKPTRLVAAQEAAKLFLQELPKNIEVGLVTFAGSSQVAQRATLDRASAGHGDRRLPDADGHGGGQRHRAEPGGAVSGAGHRPRRHDTSAATATRVRAAWTTRRSRRPGPITPVAPGSYNSAAIILLSDGRRTTGVDTLAAAKMAADRGVRIHVIGLGTVDGDAADAGRHGHLHEARRTDAARGGADDRRRVPPRRHRRGAAQRLREPGLARAGADPRDRAPRRRGAGLGGGGDGGRGAVAAPGSEAGCTERDRRPRCPGSPAPSPQGAPRSRARCSENRGGEVDGVDRLRHRARQGGSGGSSSARTGASRPSSRAAECADARGVRGSSLSSRRSHAARVVPSYSTACADLAVLLVPVGGPFPDVARHVEQAVAVGRERTDRRGHS